MAADPAPTDQIAFLARSSTRVRVLEELSNSGPTTRSACRERLDASRSTVTRALSSLEARGWIESDGRSYELTPVGEIVATSFLELVEDLEVTADLRPFLEWFPYGATDLDLADLRDANVTAASEADPYAPARRQSELLGAVTEFRGFLPALDREGSELVHERITAGQLRAEVVVSSAVADALSTADYAHLHREMLETGRLTLFVVDDELPYYIGLTGRGAVHVGVQGDDGFPRALVVTETDGARAWAESVYDACVSDARELTAADL